MFNNNYKIADKNVWKGRIDSEDNYDAFRWHQWIQFIDLSNDNIPVFNGTLGFCIIGFCCDVGVQINKGRFGAAKAPQSIRKELSNLPCWFKEEVKLFDAGDILSEDCTLEQSQDALALAVQKILNLNLFPIVLGGGHEVAFGHYNGILNYLSQNKSKPKIGIVNFDAHLDIRPYPNGGSSGTMFRQIADVCSDKELEYSYMCVGVQKYSNTVDLFKTANNLGVSYILEKDISISDDWSLIEKFDTFLNNQDHIYMTICSDVFSSAFAPGVSAPQPLGLDPETVLKFLKYIIKTKKIVSFDIAEVTPRFDQDNTTVNLAKVLIFSVVNTLCQIYNLSID
ncbi:formiminoglutamase [Sedimentibacter acidaminivorans]|jgi:formiminoglutamase|uniref:Formimidoylglutamase n=1 Tax=Sedimentibacter acidaminivorans TaxID=913099 RepID=A0ABS4GCC3_9FIRM|nr:formimidoylglutamase [Sedimentibacter acidaminivorans]MBP1925346.1 formiminoglutamase [Sedimentibacter acidaminivorans]